MLESCIYVHVCLYAFLGSYSNAAAVGHWHLLVPWLMIQATGLIIVWAWVSHIFLLYLSIFVFQVAVFHGVSSCIAKLFANCVVKH